MSSTMEKAQPFFSIVMPAYGVEQYIEKSIKSIQKQTFSDWELIVVDDCTKDMSAKIAQKIADGDSRIQVLHLEENMGLSMARNQGMKLATGNYVWFPDSDDYVDSDLLQNVFDSLKESLAQIVVFGLQEEYFDKKGKFSYAHEIRPQRHLYRNAKDLRQNIIHLEQQTLYGYAWNKIYDLNYLKQKKFQFEKVTLIEDIVFNIGYCMDITSMNLLDIAPYHYAKRNMEGSLTNKFVPDYYKLHRRRIALLLDQFQYWDMDTEDIRRVLGSLYGRYIFSALMRNCDPRAGMTHQERYIWTRRLFDEGLFNTLIPCSKAEDSKPLAILLLLLKWKRSMLCLIMGRLIYIVQMKLKTIFTKVRSGR
ncbi:MAG: glycosyltransferase family 2 protein [Hespellia sp.]|nr:glycosyltransferase family 2 protein [Hespellia sp.]